MVSPTRPHRNESFALVTRSPLGWHPCVADRPDGGGGWTLTLTGLDAAPRLKELAAQAKIIFFTALQRSSPTRATSQRLTRSFSTQSQRSYSRWPGDWRVWTQAVTGALNR